MRAKGVLFVGLTAVVGCIAALVTGAGDPLKAQSAERISFTTNEIVSIRDENGTERFAQRITYAQKSDGSTSRREMSAGRGKLDVVFEDITVVRDVARRQVIRLDAVAESSTTAPMTEREAEGRQLTPDASCRPHSVPERIYLSVTEDPEVPELLGYRVFRVTERYQLPDSSLELLTWVSPDLDCHALKTVSTMTPEGGEPSSTITTVQSVLEGSPDAGLFDVPAHYAELSPLDVFREKAERRGRECLGCEAEIR